MVQIGRPKRRTDNRGHVLSSLPPGRRYRRGRRLSISRRADFATFQYTTKVPIFQGRQKIESLPLKKTLTPGDSSQHNETPAQPWQNNRSHGRAPKRSNGKSRSQHQECDNSHDGPMSQIDGRFLAPTSYLEMRSRKLISDLISVQGPRSCPYGRTDSLSSISASVALEQFNSILWKAKSIVSNLRTSCPNTLEVANTWCALLTFIVDNVFSEHHCSNDCCFQEGQSLHLCKGCATAHMGCSRMPLVNLMASDPAYYDY